MPLKCERSNCDGEIKGRWSRQHRAERWYDGDRHACPKCGDEYVITVSDDFEDDATASLRLTSEDKP